MANNPVVNTLTFTGSVAGQASISAQGIAGNLTFLLPNTAPIVGQLLDVSAINGNNVFLGWASAQSLSNIPLTALSTAGASSGDVIQFIGGVWAVSPSAPGSGTVTSVALTAPAEFTVGGSPITAAGTLAITKATQLQNLVWASPNGSTGVPVFRALVAADIPALSALSGSLAVAQINSKVGNGNAVQLSNTGQTIVAGDVLTYDANGNVTDSGTLLSSLATSASVALKANIASPTFTGVPAAPTASPLTNSTQIATTAYTDAAVAVETARATGVEALKAPLASPTFTGTVTAPTISGINQINALGGSGLDITSAGTDLIQINGNSVGIVNVSSAGVALNNNTSGSSVTVPTSGGVQIAATGTDEVRIGTATGVFDFFGSGGANGMSLATGNASIVINSGGQITLAAAINQDIELTASGSGIIVTNATLLAEHNIDLSDANAHIVPNSDNAGTVTISNPATTVAVVYGSHYTGANAPNVVVTAVGADPTGLGGVWITHQGSTTAWTGFTINVTTTPGTSASFSYLVIG